jgi:hypothetical protein
MGAQVFAISFLPLSARSMKLSHFISRDLLQAKVGASLEPA